MKKYDFKICNPPTGLRAPSVIDWFKQLQDEGWELIGPDYTRVGNGDTYYRDHQYYIFRKEIEDTDLS